MNIHFYGGWVGGDDFPFCTGSCGDGTYQPVPLTDVTTCKSIEANCPKCLALLKKYKAL